MGLDHNGHSGLALGAWGAVQASAAGVAIALGGAIRDAVSGLAAEGLLGPAVTAPAAGYSAVYHIEIALLFATLVAVGPLVRASGQPGEAHSPKFGLAEFPG
jgi:BCD family chlorophyll transporter-like MFS transporter